MFVENEEPMSCNSAPKTNLAIESTRARGEKGNTATNALKPATTETGAEIKVPAIHK